MKRNPILNIAWLTLLEAIRNKIVIAFLILAVACLLASKGLAWVSSGEDQKVMIDMGLSVILFFGALTAAFMGANLVYQEEEKKTVFVMLTKPISRLSFLLGKYLGLMTLLTMISCITGIVFVIYYLSLGYDLNLSMLIAFYGILLEFMVLCAVAMLLSIVASPILSAIVTFLVAMIGHSTEALLELIQYVDSGAVEMLLKGIYHVAPNFHNFDFKIHAAHALPVQASLVHVTGYAFLYTAVLLWISHAFLSRRQY